MSKDIACRTAAPFRSLPIRPLFGPSVPPRPPLCRPVMTGSAQPGDSYSSSRAGSMIAASSDAGATASGEGDKLHDAGNVYGHGSVNRELLDYMHRVRPGVRAS